MGEVTESKKASAFAAKNVGARPIKPDKFFSALFLESKYCTKLML